MGRRINRLNTLGTLRHAAVYDLRVIKHEYDHQLDDIGEKDGASTRTQSLGFLSTLFRKSIELNPERASPVPSG